MVTASAFTKYLGNLTVYFDGEGELITFDGGPIFLNRSIPEGNIFFYIYYKLRIVNNINIRSSCVPDINLSRDCYFILVFSSRSIRSIGSRSVY